MRRLLLIIVAALSLQTAQLVMALGESRDFPLHNKFEGASFTMGSPLEQLLDIILTDDNGKNALFHGTTLVEQKSQEDSFGNCHVVYSQQQNGKESDYQLVLHYHPDGSLYYINGMLAVESDADAAKAMQPAKRITPQQAATVATGTPLSQVKTTLVSYKDCPHEVYEVLDSKTLNRVYVDVFSGEVLFTEPLLHSYAPWSELNGSAVTLPAMTSYNGQQYIDLLQTEQGYILRDPERNILTIDASNILKGYEKKDYPSGAKDQVLLLKQVSDDFVFTDEEQLLSAKQPAVAINNITFGFFDNGRRPKSGNIHIYYIDNDGQPVGDIYNVDLKDMEWTKGPLLLEFAHNLESGINVNLNEYSTMVDITLDDKVYSGKDIIVPGDRKAKNMYNAKNELLVCVVDVDIVNAKQPAIDVHWAVQKIYDMYKDYYGIIGFNDENFQILNIISPPNNMDITKLLPNNAVAMFGVFADDYGKANRVMVYGMGMPMSTYPYTNLATVAHEYTHLITVAYGNNLFYGNESGALHEATADCMSQVALCYAIGKPSWSFGNEICLAEDNIRDFADPWYSGSINGKINTSYAQPKYYGGRFWLDYTKSGKDNGGVHTNSGVFNHLFYLLCEGAMGSTNEMGETRHIHPIGMDRMKDILFHSMIYYNSALCSYKEIADNLMMVVEDINGQNSDTSLDLQRKMQEAFNHVGMTTLFTPTGITSVSTNSFDNSNIYDLQGRRLNSLQKGINIVGGRKIVK